MSLAFDNPEALPQGSGTLPIDLAFPVEEANALARLESFNKHLYRPNTYLHKWWARRCGTTFRYILKQLVGPPAQRSFYAPGGLEGKVILDPMMGGGTTLHEAVRMGANVIGVDLDPIPVLQVRATLHWTPVERKERAFAQFFGALREALRPFYRTACPSCGRRSETQFVLYGLRRRCDCRDVVMVDSLLLRQENDGREIRLCPTCTAVYGGEHTCPRSGEAPVILPKGTKRCPRCQAPLRDLVDLPFSERYRPLVVVGQCPEHGRFFKPFEEADARVLEQAQDAAQALDFGDPAAFDIHPGPKSRDLLRRNISRFLELFTPRQLLYLHHAQRLLQRYGYPERLWLGLLISTSLEFNALLCGYKGADRRRPGAIRHVFSHHAYSFPYTALENNPVFPSPTSGTLQRLFRDRIRRATRWAAEPVERSVRQGQVTKVVLQGEVDGGQEVFDFDDLREGTRRFLVLQGDSAALEFPADFVDFVVTDPPYYDSVQYSDLAAFFRVWLRYLLPDEARWSYDHAASAVSEGDLPGQAKYGETLTRIWQQCARALKREHGRLIFTFHHWSPDAWAELTISLKRAGFTLVNRYVVFSENPVSVHIRTLKALKHDTILVLKPGRSSDQERPQWPRPDAIDASDSYRFCLDCGSALGWFLDSPLEEERIRTLWRRFLSPSDDRSLPAQPCRPVASLTH